MSQDAIEKRLASTIEEVTRLKTEISSLNERFSAMESFHQSLLTTGEQKKVTYNTKDSAIPDIGPNQLLDKVASTSLLPRIATVCFLLVFALILRTLTNNNIINTQIGSIIGVCYASGLIMWGVKLLKNGSKLASVFKICGVFLLYMILLETHTRFESFSSFFVYTFLAGVLLSVSKISISHKLSGYNTLGIFGTALVASIIDFPTPHFGQLSILLLTANILAFISAKKIGKGEWNRLLVFILTITMSTLWILRLQAEINLNQALPAFVSASWFVPMATMFATAFAIMTVTLITGKRQFTILDLFLPTLTAIWLFPMLSAILETMAISPLIIGMSGMIWALTYLAFVGYRLSKPERDVSALTSIIIAACFLLIAALPKLTGNILPSILIWAIIGFFLTKISIKYDLNGLRFFSYIFQFIVCVIAIISGQFTAAISTPWASAAVAGILMGITCVQFKLLRNNYPKSFGFFKQVDRSDKSSSLVLITSLISCFMMLQIIGYRLLMLISTTPIEDLPGIQSFILNIGAILLFLHAKKTKKKDFLIIAIILTIINGFKVFLYDMFNTGSGPLVLSVLSFGGLAAMASLVLTKWSNSNADYSTKKMSVD